MKILDDELEREVLEAIWIDRMGVFKMYRDLRFSRNCFGRNFVMDEPFEAELSCRVYAGFLSFDMSRSMSAALSGGQNENS